MLYTELNIQTSRRNGPTLEIEMRLMKLKVYLVSTSYPLLPVSLQKCCLVVACSLAQFLSFSCPSLEDIAHLSSLGRLTILVHVG